LWVFCDVATATTNRKTNESKRQACLYNSALRVYSMTKTAIQSIIDSARNNIAAERMEQEEYIEQQLPHLEHCQVEIVWDLVKKMVEVNE